MRLRRKDIKLGRNMEIIKFSVQKIIVDKRVHFVGGFLRSKHKALMREKQTNDPHRLQILLDKKETDKE